jgi:hypothetical protein
MVKLQLKKFAGLLSRPESPELLISPKEIISLSKEISLFYLGKLNCVLDAPDEVRCAKIFGDGFSC